MRELLERELGRFTDERLRGAPVRAAVLDELLGYGIEPDLARSLVATIPLDAAESPARGLVLAHLSKSLCVDTVEPIDEHGVIAGGNGARHQVPPRGSAAPVRFWSAQPSSRGCGWQGPGRSLLSVEHGREHG